MATRCASISNSSASDRHRHLRHRARRAVRASIADVRHQPQRRDAGSWKRGGADRGFLWRLNSYWRYRQVGNGVQVDVLSLSLSRDVPWVVEADCATDHRPHRARIDDRERSHAGSAANSRSRCRRVGASRHGWPSERTVMPAASSRRAAARRDDRRLRCRRGRRSCRPSSGTIDPSTATTALVAAIRTARLTTSSTRESPRLACVRETSEPSGS